MREGKPYCLCCFDAMFAEYCDYCGDPIGVDQGQMSHDGQHWHATDHCFSCSTCRCSLLGRPFLPRRGAIFCSIACSKGEPPTPSDSSGPGLRVPRQRKSNNRQLSDNEDSTPPASPVMQTPVSPVRLMRSPQAIRSPKMGRRALQRNNQETNNIPRWEQDEIINLRTSSAGPSNTSQNQSPAPSPGPASKGLDRVLLERNLEKLLTERLPVESSVPNSPDIHRLLHSDRSREPLDLTDLSVQLDNWQQPQNHNSNYSNNSNSQIQSPHLILKSDHGMTSSMPELTITNHQHHEVNVLTPDELPTPSMSDIVQNNINIDDEKEILPEKKLHKGVRFEGVVQSQDTLPRSKSYEKPKRERRRKKNHHRKRRGTHSSREKPSPPEPSTAPIKRFEDDSGDSSDCSTCSTSSTSSDEAYELPQRRHYGGVRVSYVPNDALACARKRKQQAEVGEKDNKNCIIS